MTLGIWLVPVLLGFTVLRFAHFSRRAFTATTGYEFFFSAALAGAGLLMAAYFILLLMNSIGDALCPQLWMAAKAFWKDMAPFAHSGKLATAALLGLAFVLVANKRVSDQDAAARWAERVEGSADTLLRRSLEDRILVEISMKTGRSYVGWVLNRDPPDMNVLEDVSLVPVFSGYRDTATRNLHLTNNYTQWERLEEREVVVMRSEIASIRHFDFNAYRAVDSGEAEFPDTNQEKLL